MTRRGLRARIPWAAAAGLLAAASSPWTPTGVGALDAIERCAVAWIVGGATIVVGSTRRWGPIVVLAAGSLVAVAASPDAAGSVVGAGLAIAAAGLVVLGVGGARRSIDLDRFVGPVAAGAGLVVANVGAFGSAPAAWAGWVAALAGAGWLTGRAAGPWMAARGQWVRGVVGWGLASTAVVAAFALAGVVLAMARAQGGAAGVRDGLDAARDLDVDRAARSLDDARAELDAASRRLSSWWVAPLDLVPGVRANRLALVDLARVGSAAASSGRDFLRQVDPQALRMSGGSFDVEGLRRLGRPLREVGDRLRTLSGDLDASVGEHGIPAPSGPLAGRFAELRSAFRDAVEDADRAAEVVAVLPAVLGGDGTRHYLVLFTSPAEAREMGGFTGSYAVVRIAGGRLELVRTGHASDLNDEDGDEERQLPATDLSERYLRYRPERHWQDVTGIADFPTVGLVAATLFPQSIRGGERIDGVISLDPEAVASLLRLTGPIRVKGWPEPLGPDNVVDVLLRRQYESYDRVGDRVDFLDDVAEATFSRLTAGDLPEPQKVARVLGPAVAQRRLAAWFSTPGEQRVFAALGLDAAFPRPDGSDLLAVSHANANPSKIDAYLERAVRYEPVVDPATGAMASTVTVRLTNRAPPDGLPDYVLASNLQGLPRGTNHLLLSTTTPLDLIGAEVDGVAATFETVDELGWRRHAGFVAVPPGATVEVVFRLAGHVAPGPYRLVLVGQPVAAPDIFTVAAATKDGARMGGGPEPGWVTNGGVARFTFSAPEG